MGRMLNTGAGHGSLSGAIPFINTDYFDFRYGDISAGERYIDAQWLSSTKYVSTTMGGAQTLFGVNFADGRIKGYGYSHPGRSHKEKKFFVRFVRGDAYGTNDFQDNGDGTVTDRVTNLMWMKSDSRRGMTWEQALSYAENMIHAGYNDWRLPNAKELQYIVNYTRSPDTTGSAAIDPVFEVSSILNESNQKDYPYFWTSTTHLEGNSSGDKGVYISFGRGMGRMRGQNMDVHGAGAQRSDPKSGRGNFSRGPQGDWIRVNNYVRLVRGGSVIARAVSPSENRNRYPFSLNIENAESNQDGLSRESNTMRPSSGQLPVHVRSFIKRLDRNGDNKVSISEFDGPHNHFKHFDTDDDGYITQEEAPTGPPKRRRHR